MGQEGLISSDLGWYSKVQDEEYMHANMQSNKQIFASISTAEVSIRYMPA